ncbi:unnamed protein product [Blepharisma stoltei]|uniref:Uncharacterized protein n=1 Tax=Blepharisma stoltei TaxID=1481888 RepID=A0AAU9J0D3_9CILI|nr:unnamed protein product [Blepharisma stoltei]
MPKGLLLLLSLLWVRISSETEFQIRNGCPFFDINSKINLLQEDTYFNDNEKLEVYIKGFINKESLFSTIHQVIPNDWKEKVQIKDIRYLHPSAVWVPERNLFLVAMRVWVLSRICFIYTTFYDKDWKEVKDEIIIGSTKVPSVLDIPHSWSIENSGPEDGRLFRAFSDQFFIAFNMKKLDLSARPMFIYSYTTKKTQQLFIPEHQGKVVIMEKNWSPLIIDNEHLYFVYNFENFQIINCKTDGNCIRVHGDYKWKPGFLRGGSPFVRFRNSNYYIALSWTHTELPKEGWCYLYRPALTIAYAAAANPDFDLVYTSEPIDFHKRLFIKPAGPKDSLDDINSCHTWLMSNSIAKWDFENDIVDITLTHQDNYPVAVKATGLTKLVKSIIELYEYGKLPQEDHCADKLLYFYYNRDDLAYPGKGMEEGEFEKKIKPNCQKGEYVEPASDSCQKCHKLCAECEVYDYCKSCADPNSSPVSGYCICNDGYYSKGDICKKCSNGCAKCSARNNCLACKNPNTVIDNGICKCVEGFVEVYDQASSEFVCKTYDPNQKFGCYRGRSEIELSEYQNVMKMTFGYQETGQRLGVFLSTQKELPSIEENKFCESDITKNKVETLKTSWIEDGFEIEVDIKITKLK